MLTGDVDLLDSVLAAAAAAGVEPTVSAEPAAVRPQWMTAAIVVVGLDRARQLAELVLPHRTEVYVVGPQDDDELWRWSAPLGAAVLGLPQAAGVLTAAIADATGRPSGGGRTVSVVGASGGVGASSLAAGLAVVAAGQGLPAMLVDLDPMSGGLDLLVGAEGVPGWRWPRLVAAQGHLGDLSGHLPRLAGLDLLSAAREDVVVIPTVDAVRAVLQSAARTHRLTVVDLPRALDPGGREVLRRADLALVVVAADVRGIAAAQQFVPALREAAIDVELVVRRPRSGGVEARLVADALELPLAGVLREDAALRQGAERGDPPGRASRGPLAKLSRRLLERIDVESRAA
ncbi:helicase/secretion neighborhood CpaE-like protein [Microlunatus soli]|uniref:Helicase/secretion neighborhood CpaE-like protein n=1 Tax=Microlunatus soli TaxID=630515 RepID=A0A1H1SYM0_9ACTN|nr:helicase/secretion neighborhood CpaE-like protein [Microlunatus soli]